jgi:hypothetical protein
VSSVEGNTTPPRIHTPVSACPAPVLAPASHDHRQQDRGSPGSAAACSSSRGRRSGRGLGFQSSPSIRQSPDPGEWVRANAAKEVSFVPFQLALGVRAR